MERLNKRKVSAASLDLYSQRDLPLPAKVPPAFDHGGFAFASICCFTLHGHLSSTPKSCMFFRQVEDFWDVAFWGLKGMQLKNRKKKQVSSFNFPKTPSRSWGSRRSSSWKNTVERPGAAAEELWGVDLRRADH